MCVVIDLDAVCLVCLQPNKEMHSVFATDVESSELQIAQKISILSELKIDQNNHTLPSKICVKCLQDLKAAWRFRKNCQAAVTIFQTIVSLDVEQPEEEDNDASKDLAEKHIKVPQGLQIKRVQQVSDRKAENSSADMQTSKKSPLEEYVIVNDNSMLYDELNTHEYECRQEDREEEFQSLEGVGETNDDDIENMEENEVEDVEEKEEDDNPLVEYYITEDGIPEELSLNIETQSLVSNSATSLSSKQMKNKKVHEDKSAKRAKLTALLAKMNKPVQRGRPRNSTKQQTEDAEHFNEPSKQPLQMSKKVSCKLKKAEDLNSFENKTKTSQVSQVRQVKSRKRKSLSPETKAPKICEICGNSYRFQHALNAHMRRHFNEKPFSCEFCDKAFVSNVELRRHIRVHTGQKPYACQYCERRFSDFGSRIKHERTHTGERPYVCGTCGKSFAYPHVLSVHLRTHTGEKRFRCDYCSKGFTKKVYLQSHVEQCHVEQHHSGANNYENNDDEATNSSQEKCHLNTEYVNEEDIEDNAEYEEEENQETGKIIITSSRIQYKKEDSNDVEDDNENDDNEESIHEIVEVLPDEYTIRVR